MVTVSTPSIQTDMPEQTEIDSDQMLQNAASDQGLLFATHPIIETH